MSNDDVKKRRHYRRTQLSICKLFVSKNGTRWMPAKLEDISAGGAKFFAEGVDSDSDEIFIKLLVLSGLSEFSFTTKAEIKRRENNNVYAVKFIDFSEMNKIMLDEIINANNRRFDDI